jgi:flagellar assembly factor FliW
MTSSSAALTPLVGRRTVISDLFGALDVADDQLLRFDDGLPGFTGCKRWILIEGEKPGTAWLQSVELGAIAFLLIDPFVFFDGFSVDIAPSEVRRLEADDATQLAVFAIVTFPATRTEVATANLQGPVVINAPRRRAAQIVLSDGSWGVRQPLLLPSLAVRG